MAHVYDTDLPRAQRTVIRNAIVARLAVLKRMGAGAGLYASTIEGIVGPVSGADDADLILDVVSGQGTAILVALGRKSYAPTGLTSARDRYMANLEVFIYVVSDTQRQPIVARIAGDVAADLSNQSDPGIETMLEHIEELLFGFQITESSSTVYQLIPVDEDEVAHFQEMTIWRQSYSLNVQRELKRDKSIDAALLSVDTRSDVHGAETENPIARPLTEIFL